MEVNQTEIDSVITSRNAAAAAAIALIEQNKQQALATLNKKYAISDRFKSTAGIIGIVSLASLIALILVIDFINLMIYIFGEATSDTKSSPKAVKNHKSQKKLRYAYTP